MLAQITLPIVGVDFPNKSGPARRFGIELLEPGDAVELRPEPKNPYDEHAVAVFSSTDVQLGYLPANRAPYVGQQIRRGSAKAIFQGRSERGLYVRIAFDGDEPALPPAREELGEPDWHPDPVWDEGESDYGAIDD